MNEGIVACDLGAARLLAPRASRHYAASTIFRLFRISFKKDRAFRLVFV